MIGAAVLAAFALFVSTSAASAAPANDKFEDAQVLGPALPVLVPGSNVEATKEASGEPYGGFAAGHSVWYSWTAPSEEVVTVDNCNSDFAAVLTVFSGSALNSLVEVGGGGNRDEHDCSPTSGVTFRATSGTTYSILVDGSAFSFPWSRPPVTEGSFELKIDQLPPPPNDDFDHPTRIEGRVNDEPDGGRSYYASAQGYNWDATKEAGEPNHGGDMGGASVWFEWTAPESGPAELGECGSFDSRLGLYIGESVDALTPVPTVSVPAPCFINFVATAGTTYQIAVDGRFDAETGYAWMGGIGIHATMRLPSNPSAGEAPQSPPADTTPPRTKLFKRFLKRKGIWLFRFRSNEPGSTFRCKLDKRRFRRCHSPLRLRHLKPGRHTLRVFAVDAAGNRDRSPAVAHFRAKRPRHRHGRHSPRRHGA